MNLSAHFTLAEMEFSEIAARHGIDNQATPDGVIGLTNLCTLILEPVREHFGVVVVTSGNRNLRVNRLVGSKDTSQHIATEEHAAADIKVPGVRPLTLCDWIAAAGLPFDQLIHEFGAWSHCSWSVKPRGTLLTIDRQGTRAGLLEVR